MQGIVDAHDYPLLNICAKYNRIEIMKILIEAGLNVNAKDKVTA
jgi:ankyrin repeat protein